MQETYFGPDDLADAVLKARREPSELAIDEANSIGEISEDGIRRLIRVAYYASQSPNEGRFPRLMLLVTAKGVDVRPLVPLDNELTVQFLCRVGPTLSSWDHFLLVQERGDSLFAVGIGALDEVDFRNHASRPYIRPKGFSVELAGPGDLRAGECLVHRIQPGLPPHQEMSFSFVAWFRVWCEEVATQLLSADDSWCSGEGMMIGVIWQKLLRRATDMRHGGCFVILPAPENSPIQHSFRTHEANLGTILAEFRIASAKVFSSVKAPVDSIKSVREKTLELASLIEAYVKSNRPHQRLKSAIDVIANLSATDGCVVFNRKLELHSFGAMIEPSESELDDVPCLVGNTDEQLAPDVVQRTFGARRKSALHLCRACPGAMAFVISQDGDLRVFVREKEGVRFFDKAAYW